MSHRCTGVEIDKIYRENLETFNIKNDYRVLRVYKVYKIRRKHITESTKRTIKY